jgi:siroheme synthase
LFSLKDWLGKSPEKIEEKLVSLNALNSSAVVDVELGDPAIVGRVEF